MNTYSDFFTNFLAHPDNKELVKLNNEAAIKRSLKNIILTDNYERPHNPKFGASLSSLLFEPMTDITESSIKDKIYYSIKTYEPRVEIQSVIVQGDYDRGSYDIQVQYRILNNNQESNLNLVLKKIR
jgi:phage baseplate assembly protein W